MFTWIEANANMYVHVHVKRDTFRLHPLGLTFDMYIHARQCRHVCTSRFGGMHTRQTAVNAWTKVVDVHTSHICCKYAKLVDVHKMLIWVETVQAM